MENKHDYSNVRLGLIDRIRVWNARRIAEAQRNQYLKDEGELTEVDYSRADKLEKDLLNKRRVKRATRDARKIYKSVYGKDNDGVGESDFIDDYLIKAGLKEKLLKPSDTINLPDNPHAFMEKYDNEPNHENVPENQSEIFYIFSDGKAMSLTRIYSHACIEDIKRGNIASIPIRQEEDGKYYVDTDELKPTEKIELLKNITQATLGDIMVISSNVSTIGEPEFNDPEVHSMHMNSMTTSQIVSNKCDHGKYDEAIGLMETDLKRFLEYYQKCSENNIEKDEI